MGFSKIKRSRSILLTKENYYNLVIKGERNWLILIYDEFETAKIDQISELWDEVFSQLHTISAFGRIDIGNHPEMKDELPYNIQFTPTVILINPDGSDILPIMEISNINLMRGKIQNFLKSIPKEVKSQDVMTYLKDDYVKFPIESKPRILLLPKQPPTDEFNQLSLKFRKNVNVGYVPPVERDKVIRILKIPKETNLIFSIYISTSKGYEWKYFSYVVSKKTLSSTIHSFIRNSFIEIYKENLNSFCSENSAQESEADKSSNSESSESSENSDSSENMKTKLCIFALYTSNSKNSSEFDFLNSKLKNNFLSQSQSSKKTSEEKIKNYIIQYGRINLDFHLNLKRFLNNISSHFSIKTNDSKIHFLSYLKERESFTLFDANNLSEFEEIIGKIDDDSIEKSYFVQFDARILSLLFNEDDTFLNDLFQNICSLGRQACLLIFAIFASWYLSSRKNYSFIYCWIVTYLLTIIGFVVALIISNYEKYFY